MLELGFCNNLKVGEGKRKLSLPLAHFVGEGSGAARG